MAVGNLEFIKSASGTSITTLEITDCFSADYDVYFVTITKVDVAANPLLYFRFIDSGGTVITGSEYERAHLNMLSYTTFSEGRSTTETRIPIGYANGSGTADLTGLSAYIFNPYDSSSYTFTTSQNSSYSTSGLQGMKSIGVHKTAEQLSGVAITVNTGSLESITANIFGVK
jgi:hypothetical protein